jgi:hypothetical protein
MSNLAKENLDFVEVTGEALNMAQKIANSIMAEEQKIASLAPKVAESMVRGGVVRKDLADQARTKISTHEGALEVIQNLTSYCSELQKKQARADAASGEGKAAADNSSTRVDQRDPTSRGGFVGQREGLGQYKTASQQLFEANGIADAIA